MRAAYPMHFGAETFEGQETRFRLWAPAARDIELCLENDESRPPLPMRRLPDGWFELLVPDAKAGTRYRYLVDSDHRVPDPASRFQPTGVHGPSEVVDPTAYTWSDRPWRGRPWDEAVIYELHVGTFTPEGSFTAAIDKLDHLVDLGATAVEFMPLAATPGRRNWGYDGVQLFAPSSVYGRPEDLKTLIDAAHDRGLMVLLDVVYNHFGPEGNYLHLYAPQFFTERHHTPWGAAINLDGGFDPVRAFFVENALYWLEEYRFDGLRLDAVHAIVDDSPRHILTELAETVSAHFGDRLVHLVLENDRNESRYLRRSDDGRARCYVAQWNDDIHHAMHSLATGERGGYYEDYATDTLRLLGRCLTEGFAWQGENSPHRQGRPRGERSAHLPATAFVAFLQNHDQIGNRAMGERITALAPVEAVRALSAVFLLAPSPPLLFMGQEWGAPEPFLFFCDFGEDLADAVREGRRREFSQFPAFRDPEARKRIPDPNAEETFHRSLLDWATKESPAGKDWLALHRNLLSLRHREIVPRLTGLTGHAGRFAIHGERGISAFWNLPDGATLALLANLGPVELDAAPTRPEGRLLYSSGPEMADGLERGCWPPWSVAWLLHEKPGTP